MAHKKDHGTTPVASGVACTPEECDKLCAVLCDPKTKEECVAECEKESGLAPGMKGALDFSLLFDLFVAAMKRLLERKKTPA